MKTKCYVCKKKKQCGKCIGVNICEECGKSFIPKLPICPEKLCKVTKDAKTFKMFIDDVKGL